MRKFDSLQFLFFLLVLSKGFYEKPFQKWYGYYPRNSSPRIESQKSPGSSTDQLACPLCKSHGMGELRMYKSLTKTFWLWGIRCSTESKDRSSPHLQYCHCPLLSHTSFQVSDEMYVILWKYIFYIYHLLYFLSFLSLGMTLWIIFSDLSSSSLILSSLIFFFALKLIHWG